MMEIHRFLHINTFIMCDVFQDTLHPKFNELVGHCPFSEEYLKLVEIFSSAINRTMKNKTKKW